MNDIKNLKECDEVLSVEQMKHLKDLNVDLGIATFYYRRDTSTDANGFLINNVWRIKRMKDLYASDFDRYDIIPTFTLSNILELLPKEFGIIENMSCSPKIKINIAYQILCLLLLVDE